MRLPPFEWRELAAVYLGGMVGALARVGLADAFPTGVGQWPWPTFAVNMVGALLLGYIVARLHDRGGASFSYPLLTTGFCGTLTTFSTLQLELYEMVDRGDLLLAAAYCGATLIGGLLFVRAGGAVEHTEAAR